MPKISLAQTTSTDDLQSNLAVADDLIRQAVAGGADLLAFPEVFLFIGGRQKKIAIAEPLDGPIVTHFREAAAKHKLMLLLGSVHEQIPGNQSKVHNTAVLIAANGDLIETYRKLKLFDVELAELRIKESDSILPGVSEPPVVDTPIGRIGLTICFDLRYPELYQGLRARGAEIVFVPSNFTAPTGAAHWEVLLRARAIENQLFVAAPAQHGQHHPRYRSYGHSMIVDPWGQVLTVAPPGIGLVSADIELERLHKVRRELPMGGSLA